MKLTFKEFFEVQEYEQLNEKLIVYNNGKKYGQIVFLAGGSASGKGYARKQFMGSESFKVRDVDELKSAFQELSALNKFTTKQLMQKYGNKLSEKDRELVQSEIIDKGLTISKLSMKNPTHVYLLHMMIKATGAKEKTLALLLQGAKIGRLPNILFDITFKDTSEFDTTVKELLKVGYEPRNIHLTWVLTDYQIAIKSNKNRGRVVPDDILLQTHEGAAQTVYKLISDGTPSEINGRVDVILNNKENTIPFKNPDGSPVERAGRYEKDLKVVVRDFTYLNVKEAGKSAKKEIEVKTQLLRWIRDNTPEGTLDTSELDRM